MAATQFDKPRAVNITPYQPIQEYKPLPMEPFAAAVASKQKQLDELEHEAAEAPVMDIKAGGSVKSFRGADEKGGDPVRMAVRDQQLVRAKEQQLQKRLEGIYEKIEKEGADPLQYQDEIRNIAREARAWKDTVGSAIEQNWKKIEEWNTMRDKSEGAAKGRFREFDEELARLALHGGTVGPDGSIYTLGSARKREDVDIATEANKLLEGINAISGLSPAAMEAFKNNNTEKLRSMGKSREEIKAMNTAYAYIDEDAGVFREGGTSVDEVPIDKILRTFHSGFTNTDAYRALEDDAVNYARNRALAQGKDPFSEETQQLASETLNKRIRQLEQQVVSKFYERDVTKSADIHSLPKWRAGGGSWQPAKSHMVTSNATNPAVEMDGKAMREATVDLKEGFRVAKTKLKNMGWGMQLPDNAEGVISFMSELREKNEGNGQLSTDWVGLDGKKLNGEEVSAIRELRDDALKLNRLENRNKNILFKIANKGRKKDKNGYKKHNKSLRQVWDELDPERKKLFGDTFEDFKDFAYAEAINRSSLVNQSDAPLQEMDQEIRRKYLKGKSTEEIQAYYDALRNDQLDAAGNVIGGITTELEEDFESQDLSEFKFTAGINVNMNEEGKEVVFENLLEPMSESLAAQGQYQLYNPHGRHGKQATLGTLVAEKKGLPGSKGEAIQKALDEDDIDLTYTTTFKGDQPVYSVEVDTKVDGERVQETLMLTNPQGAEAQVSTIAKNFFTEAFKGGRTKSDRQQFITASEHTAEGSKINMEEQGIMELAKGNEQTVYNHNQKKLIDVERNDAGEYVITKVHDSALEDFIKDYTKKYAEGGTRKFNSFSDLRKAMGAAVLTSNSLGFDENAINKVYKYYK